MNESTIPLTLNQPSAGMVGSGDTEKPINVTGFFTATLRGGSHIRPSIEVVVKKEEDYEQPAVDYDDYDDYDGWEGDDRDGSNESGEEREMDDDDDGDWDSYSTNSNWDEYGSVPTLLKEYEDVVAGLEGNESWNEEQRKLHQLIYMRGFHPMMHSWWRMNFKMWGITQESMDDVFAPPGNQKRLAIHAFGNEVAGKWLL
jgi:hypothetical protein